MKTLLYLFIFTIACQYTLDAQIHDIKKKSDENRNSTSHNTDNYNDDSNDFSDNITNDVVGCCVSNIFEFFIDGCLTGIFNSRDKNVNPANDLDNNYMYNEPSSKTSEGGQITDNATNTYDNSEAYKHVEDNGLIYNKEKLSLDINALFDASIHKGINKNYFHIDYLPGLRANIFFVILDFRFNMLTQPSVDDIDAFKSWEFMFMINFTANQDYSIMLGAGLYKETYNGGNNFNEYYGGFVIPLNNKNSYIDVDTRVAVDFRTKDFPFFECGGRYNIKILRMKHLSTYLTLGLSYQNYYQSYDIFGFRSGLVFNIH